MRHPACIIAGMYSAPSAPRPCWHCNAFAGMTAQGTAALCSRPGCCRVFQFGMVAGRCDGCAPASARPADGVGTVAPSIYDRVK